MPKYLEVNPEYENTESWILAYSPKLVCWLLHSSVCCPTSDQDKSWDMQSDAHESTAAQQVLLKRA